RDHPRLIRGRRVRLSTAAGREWALCQRYHPVGQHESAGRWHAGLARAPTDGGDLRPDGHTHDDRLGRTDQGDGAMSEEFIGSGWAFPMRTDATGRIALVSREQEIEESMRLILGTAIGERPMRPEFGCEIHDYVLESADAETAARVAAAVRASLRRWEPRIEVRDVIASFDTEDSSTIYIDIRYTVGETNDPRNLVFPFYVIPAEST